MSTSPINELFGSASASTNLTIILGFAATCLTMIYNAWNASAERLQALAIADRKIAEMASTLATKTETDKHALAELVLRTAMEVRQKTIEAAEQASLRNELAVASRAGLADQLSAVQQNALDAFHEANSVNVKIAALHTVNNVMLTKLDEVNESAKNAYHEANSVNVKIADLHREGTETNERLVREQSSNNSAREEQLTHIDSVGMDTNTKVDKLIPPAGSK